MLSTDPAQTLVEQVRTGDLDVALALLSADGVAPGDVTSHVLTAERFVLVRAKRSRPRARRSSPSNNPDSSTPAGCLTRRGCVIRQALEVRLRGTRIHPRGGCAEINNIEMQLSLVASGIGLGLIPERFLAAHPKRRRLKKIARSGVSLEASIVFMHANHLGRLETAATFLEREFRSHFADR